VNPAGQTVLLLADAFPNYSICGLPFYISGETPFVLEEEFQAGGLELLPYPGAHRLTLRVTSDRRSGRLLGAQIVGHHQAQVAKRIDIFASALYEGLTVDAVNALDLSYTPPFGAPWDPVQVAAPEWLLRA
jgi:Pyridine nucleotide-disulphide oxidoreductase, dimerisation domain